jgi:DNA-binding NarL/FixJ family response regulator
MALLCNDQLFVQNQVNRPRFSKRELDDYLRDHEKRDRAIEIAEATFAARPLLSPRELVVMTALAKKGKKNKFVERVKKDFS